VHLAGNVIALDLASLLGFAVGRLSERPRFGSFQLPSTAEDVGRYISAYDDWLQPVLDFEEPEGLLFEAPSLFMKTTPITVEKLNGLATHTQFLCHRRGVRCWSANPSKLKSHWTGRGNAQKPDMMEVARRCGFQVLDDNQSDAIAIFSWAVECFGAEADKQRWATMRAQAQAGLVFVPKKPRKPKAGKSIRAAKPRKRAASLFDDGVPQ
jgi:plasmid stabilization system protein ParE